MPDEKFLRDDVADLASRQGDTLSVLDKLRATRRMRGGVGAPLIIPNHLRDSASGRGLVITDQMIAGQEEVPNMGIVDEEELKQ